MDMLYTFRLKPNQDLKVGIEAFVKNRKLKAASILTCVGSLVQVKMRMAGAQPAKQDVRGYSGHYEIVSLVGTISPDGSHLHLAVSDEAGTVIGGHLKEGTVVHTTAEVVIAESESENYSRTLDESTSFPELEVKQQ